VRVRNASNNMVSVDTDKGAMAEPPDEGWSDEEIESLLGTAILLGIVTILIYFVVLRPIFNPKNENNGAAAGAQQQRQQLGGAARNATDAQMAAARAAAQRPAARGRNGGAGAARAAGADSASSSLPSIVAGGNRKPSHLADGCTGGPSASRYLVEGLISFRRSKAGAYETGMQKAASCESEQGQSVVDANRRSRARLFAKLLNSAVTGSRTSTPPPRGSNVIVCIPSTDVSCTKLHRALWLLGTYYNLFLVLCLPQIPKDEGGNVDESEKERDLMASLRKELRQSGLRDDVGVPTDVLPDHRIVAVRSIEGRVAFVRQMHRPEFVLDFDAEMKTQLERFGFTVLLYGQKDEQKRSSDGISLLAKSLML